MRFFILAFVLCLPFFSFGQGTTTSEMRGIVMDVNGSPVIGATVVAVHLPSGTTYGTATDIDGTYQVPGMRVGGPYHVTVTFTGYSPVTLENVELRLGETFRRNFILEETNIQLDAVTVVAASGVKGQSAGTSTQINSEQIESIPSLDRDIDDYLRLTPQANTYGDGISFAGINNRYNAIYIDGAVNNDVYGLASSGTNGGQTGISPFSIDIIDQFQVVLAPYDVSLGGFAGGGINAVTKSGTNTFKATAYYFTQNESLAGKTNYLLAQRLVPASVASERRDEYADSIRMKLPDFSKNVFGASLGGPITKDKLFFFINAEIQDDETPIPFETEQYTLVPGRLQNSDLDNLRTYLITTYGYDPGGYGSTRDELSGLKLFGKLDFNLSDMHRLTFRHQYTKAEQFDRNSGSTTTINFENNGVFFPSTTNSTAFELNSRFGQSTSNSLILGFTKVHDDRDAIGSDFPFVIIRDASNGTVRFGSEEFSTANLLDQSTFTITNNLKLYKRNHIFTLGTHNEFYSFRNVFIGQNFGSYTFASLSDFINGANAASYVRSYSLIDEVSGDDTDAAADFNAIQLGFYAQDEWAVAPRFTLTGGLRVDIPIITTDPVEDELFNDTIDVFQAAYPEAEGVVAGKAPDGQIMFSPRLGFEFDVAGNRNTIIRGGLGIFTSRIPFVWPGAMFTNNGLTIGRVTQGDIPGGAAFRPDVSNQYTNPNFAIPSGQVDLFTQDFKYPQVFRTNLAWDQRFADGFEFSLEGLFTKTLNNIVYTQINSDPTVSFTWTGSGDNRNVYVSRDLVGTYGGGVYLASNTNEGYTYNLTASLSKQFGRSFMAYVAYNYGDGKAVQEGTSSQNSSQWRGQTSINGRNFPVLGRTDFAIGHRILTNLTYRKEWSDGFATSVSLFYNGESGEAFSYVIGGSTGQNVNRERGSTGRNRTLIYVPLNEDDINLVEYTAGGVTVSAADQWVNFNRLIESDKGLSERRGQYVEKNGSFAPFNSVFDLVLRQDLGTNLGGDLHRLQLSVDILNVANLLNKEWGAFYTVPGTPGVDFNNFQILQFEGYEADMTTPRFTYRQGDRTGRDLFDIAGTASRWRMRLGIRYILN